ncbi:MAG: helix-turn-helix transcriptional regulator [Candidatus Schekmanbacteria bacterium]|nr:helix-turn-helix transcriptional regulator [Candidatus Schekmanbacteria bacterium]
MKNINLKQNTLIEAGEISCENHVIDRKRVESVSKQLLNDTAAIELAELYRALGDGTRVKILYTLSLGEFCVCDISSLLGMSSSAISHQLRILRSLRLVKNRRAGRVIYYSLDDEHVVRLFEEGLKHIEHR